MAVDIDIRLLARKQIKALESFDKKVAERAGAQALNRTINNMQKVAIEEGARFLGVSKNTLEKRFSFNLKENHGAIGIIGARPRVRMEAKGIAKGRPFNIVRWDAQQTSAGVVANAWGSTKLYKDTLIVRAPGRFVAKLNRSNKGKKRVARKGVFGPGLTHAIENQVVRFQIQREGERKFPQHYASAANRFMQLAGYSGVRR